MCPKPQVLLIENEPDSSKLISAALEQSYQSVLLNDVDTAWKYLEQHEPSVLITDVDIKGEDVFTITKRVHDRYPNLPVIIITGESDKAGAIKALQSGAFDYIDKPFDLEKLQWSVARAVQNRNLQLTLEQARLRSLDSKRLATIGRMAGSIAHEVNTPLATIKLHTDLIKNLLNQEEIDHEKINKSLAGINKVVDHTADLLKSMLQFTRSKPNSPFVQISLQEIMGHVYNLCRKQFCQEDVELELAAENLDTYTLRCRPVEIAQILLNLILNGRDAAKCSPSPWVKLEYSKENEHIIIKVRDNGAGADPESVEHMFEPFYTTKDLSEGTGLGLAVALEIAQAHSGTLTYAREGQTTVFTLRLPVNPRSAPLTPKLDSSS